MQNQTVAEHTAWPTSIRERRPSAEDKALFRDRGYIELPDLWTPPMSDALAQEAARLFADAVDPASGPRIPVSAGRRTGKVTRVATGSVIQELHASLAGYVRALSGQMLLGSVATYGYFPDDDGVVLHCDGEATEIVLLTTALGEVGPLSVRPELRGATPAELGALESDPTWDRNGGHLVHYPTYGVAAVRGAALPHHRTARSVPTLSAVAALHYRSPY